MIVKFFVIQMNKQQERKNKFIAEVDLDPAFALMNDTTHVFNKKAYIIVEQRVFKEPHRNVVAAYCYESKLKVNETLKEDTSSRGSENGRFYEQ